MSLRIFILAVGRLRFKMGLCRSNVCSIVIAAFAIMPLGCAAPGPSAGGPSTTIGSKGAAWTIRCVELSGPNRNALAEQFSQTLRVTPGIRPGDVFYQDDPDGFIRLYYGRYRWRTDRGSEERMPGQMRADLDMIKQLGDPSTGQRYFFHAIPIRMPQPDVGNPQWRLKNAHGKYSLQVAVFEPTDAFSEFKAAAAEHCANLRAEGFDAYYHHSPVSSVVTVGAFGPDAVTTRFDGSRYQSIYSPEVAALQQHEILKHNLLNGRVYYAIDDKGNRVPVYSRLVEIPRTED